MTDKPLCPVCKSHQTHSVRLYRAQLAGSQTVFGGLSIWICEQCQMQFAWPVPSSDDLETYYRATYRAADAVHRLTPTLRQLSISRARAQLDFIFQSIDMKPKTRWLDIGSGYGFLLDEARRHRFTMLDAVEVDADSIARLKQQSYTIYNNVSDIPSQTRYDVISFSHLLEHLSDPIAFLDPIRNLLDKDGLVFCEVPNTTNLDAMPNDAPHLLFFMPDTLADVFERSSYTIVNVQRSQTPINKTNQLQSILNHLRLRIMPRLVSTLPRSLDRIIYREYYEQNDDGQVIRLVAKPK